MTKNAAPIHPGEILREEFIVPLKLTAGKVAKAIDVPRTRVERIVEETTPITADTAVRLGKFFGNSSSGLQSANSPKRWRRSKPSGRLDGPGSFRAPARFL
jgi:addiction module HigA family antidote